MESLESRCVVFLQVLFHSFSFSFIYNFLFYYFVLFLLLIFFFIIATFPVYHLYIVKKRPKLKSKNRHPVEAYVEYMKTINDFDDLVYPRTLARHCLGLEPSAYVLRAIEIEEKKNECSFWLVTALGSLSSIIIIIFFYRGFFFAKMTSKFNQLMYAQIKAKKNEPLSSLGKRVVRVVEKGASVTPTTFIL